MSPTTSPARRSCRRRRCGAWTATIPTSWSPPTRARPPSPTTPPNLRGQPRQVPRPLARRRVRLRRQRVGYDHKAMEHRCRAAPGRAWRALLPPRLGHRHPGDSLHRGRRRRHVGRRVRQRHAAVAAHAAGRGLRPSPRLHRSEPRARRILRRARAALQAAAFVMGRLRRRVDLARRRRVGALGEVDPDLAAGARGAGHRGRPPAAHRAPERDPEGPGGPPLQRRHRHLREGEQRVERRRRRPRQRCAAHRRARPAREGGGRGRQPRLHAARAHRGRHERRAHQHRRDRQLGGRRHLRPRGQHQDPARAREAQRRRDHREAAATRCSGR